jgi:release factor glutamine methyltransferase
MKTDRKRKITKVSFYGLNFLIDEDSFIPYNESEALVDLVLSYKPTSLLDLGTGIGNLSITIAKNLPDCKIQATDISKENLDIAKKMLRYIKLIIKYYFLKVIC